VALSAHPPLAVGADDPQHWLGPSALIDLEDPKLRLRVRALTQLCKNDREKALAIYSFVKRLPLSRRVKLRPLSAREVFDAGRGDASDKATLLVAMLRLAQVPARMRFVSVSGEVLRGIAPGLRQAARPLVEVWLHERWLRTDTYIFDPTCMAAARQRLKDRGWEWGYGIHVNGHMLWDGLGDAFLGGVPTECDLMVVREFGVFHDARGFVRSRAFRSQYSVARILYWTLLAPVMEWVLRGLRSGPVRPLPPSSELN
jgi:hypothetical protein